MIWKIAVTVSLVFVVVLVVAPIYLDKGKDTREQRRQANEINKTLFCLALDKPVSEIERFTSGCYPERCATCRMSVPRNI